MFDNVSSFLSKLNNQKELIQELFEKRNRNVSITDILYNHEKLNYETIEKIEELDIVSTIYETDTIKLNDTIIEFLENFFDTSKVIRIGTINEDLIELKNDIDDYKDKRIDLKRRQKKFNNIKRYLRRIPLALNTAYIELNNLVRLEYSAQSSFYEKKKELERYKTKLEELIDAELAVTNVIESENPFFQLSGDIEILYLLSELKIHLSDLRSSLLHLENKVIEYIGKIEKRKNYIEHVISLKELIQNHELQTKTNIVDIMKSKKLHKAMFFSKNYKTNFFLSNQSFYYDHVQERIRKQLDSIELDKKAIEIPPPVNEEFFEDNTFIDDDVYINEVHEEFILSDLDLFTFLKGYDYDKQMSFEDILTLYAQIISSYEDYYDITNDFIEENNRLIAKCYINKDY